MTALPVKAELLANALNQRLRMRANVPEVAQCNIENDTESTSAFNFPTLSPDGSIDDISAVPVVRRSYPPTPPAALSSLGAKSRMAEHNTMSESVESFADSQYDMIDDMSEASNDDNDTASLASTEHATSDDDAELPEYIDTVVNTLATPQHAAAKPKVSLADFAPEDAAALLDTFLLQESLIVEEEAAVESFLSEDLETPRQSKIEPATVRTPPSLSALADKLRGRKNDTAPPANAETKLLAVATKAKRSKVGKGFNADTAAKVKGAMMSGVFYAPLLLCLYIGWAVMAPLWAAANPLMEASIRREGLVAAFGKFSNSTAATKVLGVDHLVPMPNVTGTNILGQNVYGMPYTSAYQSASPNHVIISLTKVPTKISYPYPDTVRVTKGDREIAYNMTTLINSIYALTIDPTEAHGVVNIQMLTKNPKMNVTVNHSFGNRMLQRQTYENVGTELSKSVNKDLIVARDAAKSLGEKLRIELSAGAVATKNVTTQLVVYIARDLQIFTNSAASLLGKVGQASNNTATAIRKDLVLATRDIVAFGRSLKKSVSNSTQSAKALVPSKKTVVSPLKLSRERAVGLKQKLLGSKTAVNNTTASKELSIYFNNLFKSGAGTKKPSKLRDIARCLPARDYSACKKAHRESSMATSISSTVLAKAQSTVKSSVITSSKPSARATQARKDWKEDLTKWAEQQTPHIRKMQAATDLKNEKQRKREVIKAKSKAAKAAKLKRTA